MINREALAWGVRLSVQPFADGEHQSLSIQSEISHYKQGRGCDIRITFSGVSITPLRIIDAQTWQEALGAVIAETRTVATEMKSSAVKAAETKVGVKSKMDGKSKTAKKKSAKKRM